MNLRGWTHLRRRTARRYPFDERPRHTGARTVHGLRSHYCNRTNPGNRALDSRVQRLRASRGAGTYIRSTEAYSRALVRGCHMSIEMKTLTDSESQRETANMLVIEDDPRSRKVLEAYLSGAGYKVRSAPDGQSGLDLANELVPDVV